MNLELKKIKLQEIEFFQQKMVESFQSGVMDRFGDVTAAPIPPEDDLSRTGQHENCDLWAIMLDGVPAGAAAIEKDEKWADIHLICCLFLKNSSIKKSGSKVGS